MKYIQDFELWYTLQIYFKNNIMPNLVNDDKVWAHEFRRWLKEQGAEIEHLMNQFIPTHDLDPSVFIHATSKEEMQEQNREIDRQKRIDNPDFKGAFHEKKFAIKAKELSRRGSQAAWKNKNKKGK